MPKKFMFYGPEEDDGGRELLFEGELKGAQCQANTKQGNRCRRRCVIGFEYCRPHLGSVCHLMISTSRIKDAGLGLFAYDKEKDRDVVFERGEKICSYNGEMLTDAQVRSRYKTYTAPYAMQIAKDKNIDAALERGVGSIINAKPMSKSNARLAVTKDKGKITGGQIICCQPIMNHQEIYVGYGESFKFNEKTKHYTREFRRKKEGGSITWSLNDNGQLVSDSDSESDHE